MVRFLLALEKQDIQACYINPGLKRSRSSFPVPVKDKQVGTFASTSAEPSIHPAGDWRLGAR